MAAAVNIAATSVPCGSVTHMKYPPSGATNWASGNSLASASVSAAQRSFSALLTVAID